jgi:hypothetical protein
LRNIVPLVLLISLLVFTVIRFSAVNTPPGDDFAFDSSAKSNSPLSYTSNLFKNYSARVTNLIIVESYFEVLSPFQSAKLVPAISILCLVVSFYLVIRSFYSKINKYYALSLGILFTAIIMLSTLSVYENFFWFPGFISYIFPTLCLAMVLYAIRVKECRFKYATIFIISFVFGFISEPFNLQATILLLFLGADNLIALKHNNDNKKRVYPLYMISIVGILLATTVMVLAPGTKNRLALYKNNNPDKTISVRSVAEFTVANTCDMSKDFIAKNAVYLLVVSLIMLTGLEKPRLSKTSLFIHKFGAYLLVVVASVPLTFLPLSLVFSTNLNKPTFYTLVTSNVLIYFSLIIIPTLIFNNMFKEAMPKGYNYGRNAILITSSLGCLGLLLFYQIYYPKASKQHLINTELFVLLDSKRKSNELVINPNTYDNDKLFTYCTINHDPKNWCNQATAAWYGIGSITLEDEQH